MDVILEERNVCVGARSKKIDVEFDIYSTMAQSALDAWCWTGEDVDSYTVQSGYKVMLDRELYHLCERCPDVWDIRA